MPCRAPLQHPAGASRAPQLNPGGCGNSSSNSVLQHRCQGATRQAWCGRSSRRAGPAVAASARRTGGDVDPYALLQVARGSSRRQIRAAYIERIKLLHPDVSESGEESTAEAAAVNAAYERLMAGFDSNSRDDDDDEFDPLAVFDFPEAEPDQLFVNPFACYGISPLQWEELQAAAVEAAQAGRDPWLSLQQQGVQCSEGAFVYLSPRQLALVREELGRASAAMDPTSMEAAAYYLSDCLLRARVGNSRMPSSRRARWG